MKNRERERVPLKQVLVFNSWTFLLFFPIIFYVTIACFGKIRSIEVLFDKNTTEPVWRQVSHGFSITLNFFISLAYICISFAIFDIKSADYSEVESYKLYFVYWAGIFLHIFDYFTGVPVYLGISPIKLNITSLMIFIAWEALLGFCLYFMCTRPEKSIWNRLKPFYYATTRNK